MVREQAQALKSNSGIGAGQTRRVRMNIDSDPFQQAGFLQGPATTEDRVAHDWIMFLEEPRRQHLDYGLPLKKTK